MLTYFESKFEVEGSRRTSGVKVLVTEVGCSLSDGQGCWVALRAFRTTQLATGASYSGRARYCPRMWSALSGRQPNNQPLVTDPATHSFAEPLLELRGGTQAGPRLQNVQANDGTFIVVKQA